jgi:hypothetical protein
MATRTGRPIRLTLVFAIVCGCACLTLVPRTPLNAQQVDGDLGVQGTMAFNVIWNTANTAVFFKNSVTGLRPGEGRYSGRVALRIWSGMYVGASVSSWQFNFTRLTGTSSIDAVSEAVDLSPYAQLYPFRRIHLFLRGGIGYVRDQAFVGSGRIIEGVKGNHLSGSTGLGADFALRTHVALTLSADYTRVLGTTTYAEGESAIMIGVGLTVH